MLQSLLAKLNELIRTEWELRDWDDSGDPTYNGYVNPLGEWKIEETNSSEKTKRVKYGRSGYMGAWQNREQLTYNT